MPVRLGAHSASKNQGAPVRLWGQEGKGTRICRTNEWKARQEKGDLDMVGDMDFQFSSVQLLSRVRLFETP